MSKPIFISASVAPLRVKPTNYPAPFANRMEGRRKRTLGDLFGLKNFGVNLTCLAPGGQSALFHRHSRQDEFIYILAGAPILITDETESQLEPGDCAGFPAGGTAHQLVNRTDADVVYLEIGDRTAGDTAEYPRDDLQAAQNPDGSWRFLHKDGAPY